MQHKFEILDEIVDLAAGLTEQDWQEAARMAIENNIAAGDMVAYVDHREPAEQEDWTLRAELFETMLWLMSAVCVRLNGVMQND